MILENFLKSQFIPNLNEKFIKLFSGHFETGIEPDEWNWKQGRDPENVTRQICNAWKADNSIKDLVCHEVLGRACAELINWNGSRLLQDNVLWKPLYLHDHGVQSMTTSPGCQWDSGCVGAIYITHDQIREQQSIKGELSEKDLALAELGLSCDIERYNAFLTGDTWGIQISQKVNKCNLPYYQSVADNLAEEDWEWIDSCFGLYGDDGLMAVSYTHLTLPTNREV